MVLIKALRMLNYLKILQSRKVPVRNFLEIGSRDGRDSEIFSTAAGISEVYIVEPAPQSYDQIVKQFPRFNVFNCALSNHNGIARFHNVVGDNQNQRGMSSLMDRGQLYDTLKAQTIEVPVRTGSAFFELAGVDAISACKIDVEGHAYEVLEGFGNDLPRIHSMHLECEVVPVWDNQKLFADSKALLESNGFVLIGYSEYNQPTTQCDSIWIHSSVLA
jgi:FkbM family methyltransferase